MRQLKAIAALAALAACAATQGTASAGALIFSGGRAGPGATSLHRANTDGTGLQTIYTVATGSLGISTLAIDEAHQKVYWNEVDAGLKRANLDGSGVEAVVAGFAGRVEDLVVDSRRGHFYVNQVVASGNTNSIVRYDLDGNNATTIVQGILGGQELAIDEVNGRLYFGDSTDPSGAFGTFRVRSTDLDGMDARTILGGSGDLSYVGLLEVDPVVGSLYISNYEGISRANLDGTGLENLTPFQEFSRFAIDPSGSIYATTGATGRALVRSDLDLSNLAAVPGLGDFPAPYFIAHAAPAAVPEPSSLALGALATTIGLVCRPRRRK